jgi:hypothetical protein
VIKQLRQSGLFRKEDIRRYHLLDELSKKAFFASKRFRFVVEWDPTSLKQTDEYGNLPIHYAANVLSIQGFRMVFEYGIRYYPKKKGINFLFKKDELGKTPFQDACKLHDRDELMMVIEDTLNNPNISSLNSVEALLLAAIDDDIHLDCVYHLMRRDPDVLQTLLSPVSLSPSSTPSVSSAAAIFETTSGYNFDNGVMNSNSNNDTNARGSNHNYANNINGHSGSNDDGNSNIKHKRNETKGRSITRINKTTIYFMDGKGDGGGRKEGNSLL